MKYSYQFMNQSRVAESCGGTFQIPGVIDIVLKDKHSRVVVSQIDSTAKNSLKNDVRERVLAVLYIENANRRIYAELLQALKRLSRGAGQLPKGYGHRTEATGKSQAHGKVQCYH